MLGLVGDVVPHVKLANASKARFDTFVNKLHYRVTVGFLILCCILVTANDYIGAPIQCIIKASHGDAGQFAKAVNTYCWISSTFTLPEAQEDGAHPGVGPGTGEKVYHAYYQWVPFVLFFQAVLFYTPHFIWRSLEQGMLKKLLEGVKAKAEEGQFKKVAEYLANSVNTHTALYIGFVFCELLSFIVVVGNIAFTDTFLGGEFSTYGTQVLDFINQDDETRTDPMTKVFPRVTKCDWHQYGPSGSIQKVDALCILAVNIINEKIYVFLWFWLIVLAVVTGGRLLLRVVEACVPTYRQLQLRRGLKNEKEAYFAEYIVAATGISDWFIIREMKKHLNDRVYFKFLQTLAEELGASPRLQDEPDSESKPAQGKSLSRRVSQRVKQGMTYV